MGHDKLHSSGERQISGIFWVQWALNIFFKYFIEWKEIFPMFIARIISPTDGSYWWKLKVDFLDN